MLHFSLLYGLHLTSVDLCMGKQWPFVGEHGLWPRFQILALHIYNMPTMSTIRTPFYLGRQRLQTTNYKPQFPWSRGNGWAAQVNGVAYSVKCAYSYIWEAFGPTWDTTSPTWVRG